MRRGQRRVAVWVGRGATARPREVEWSSRVAAVFWGCYNKNIFKGPINNDHDISVLYNKDGLSRLRLKTSQQTASTVTPKVFFSRMFADNLVLGWVSCSLFPI